MTPPPWPLALGRFDGDPHRRRDRPRRRMGSSACRAATAAGAPFDADNTHSYLNHIPFADHGALLDPPTSDVTARCVGFLAQHRHTRPITRRWRVALAFLRDEQEADGSWFGRWGTNYIYGTWSVLCGA